MQTVGIIDLVWAAAAFVGGTSRVRRLQRVISGSHPRSAFPPNVPIQDAAYDLLRSRRQVSRRRRELARPIRWHVCGPTRFAGASIHPSGHDRSGYRMVGKGRAAVAGALGQCRSDCAFHPRHPADARSAGWTGAWRTRIGAPTRPATQGYGAAVVEETYARARELCRHLGHRAQSVRGVARSVGA
jgi:hypothetical protein